jgi:hypothetical protein
MDGLGLSNTNLSLQHIHQVVLNLGSAKEKSQGINQSHIKILIIYPQLCVKDSKVCSKMDFLGGNNGSGYE